MEDNSPMTPEQTPAPPQVKKKELPRKVRGVLLAILLAAAVGAGIYFWQDKKVKDLDTKNTELSGQVDSLADQLDMAVDSSDHTHDTSGSSTLTKENITDAVSSGNYAALESHMADKVRVILAASEGIGDRTPAQAVADMKYLDAATEPWNFSLSEETLLEWRFGDYASYFPITAVVGQSANNYVVSFQFNPEGKIAVVFFAMTESL